MSPSPCRQQWSRRCTRAWMKWQAATLSRATARSKATNFSARRSSTTSSQTSASRPMKFSFPTAQNATPATFSISSGTATPSPSPIRFTRSMSTPMSWPATPAMPMKKAPTPACFISSAMRPTASSPMCPPKKPTSSTSAFRTTPPVLSRLASNSRPGSNTPSKMMRSFSSMPLTRHSFKTPRFRARSLKSMAHATARSSSARFQKMVASQACAARMWSFRKASPARPPMAAACRFTNSGAAVTVRSSTAPAIRCKRQPPPSFPKMAKSRSPHSSSTTWAMPSSSAKPLVPQAFRSSAV